MRRLWITLTAALLVATVIGTTAARAEAPAATCTIFEIRASNEAGGIDAELQALDKKLKKPPFSAWTRFAKLAVHKPTLTPLKSSKFKLVTGGYLSLLYRGLNKAEGMKPRLRLSLTLDDSTGKRAADTTIVLDSGDYFLLGGQSLPNGATYVLALACESN